MGSDLWKLVRDGNGTVAIHAVLAAAVKHSPLLGEFLDLVVREQFRLFNPTLSNKLLDEYLEDCRGRDPDMPQWNESTRRRLRPSVYQILAQAGYLENTRASSCKRFMWPTGASLPERNHEEYVLRCIQVAP